MVQTASKVPLTTSSPSKRFTAPAHRAAPLRSPLQLRRGGFTLIEILIVLAIVSVVMALGLPAIERITYQRVNSTTRKFIGVVRTIRNDAILLNVVQRLAVDFEHRTWWVEQQKRFELLSDAPEEVSKKKKKKNEKEEPPSNFMFSEKFGKKPIPLPSGVAIDGVFKEREGLVKEGIAYVHFFPNGFNEQAILYINKDGATSDGYSLLVRPTGGKVEVYRSYIKNFDLVNR